VAQPSQPARGSPPGSAPPGHHVREPYIDFLRALSLLVVVVWHWAFTILGWGPDGPWATSPLGFTSGLWIATWLLQVMPLFFYVGGYVHLLSWQRSQARGMSLGQFVWQRLRRLAIPGAALLGTWVVLGLILGNVFDLRWIGSAVLLVVSPLWFLAVYLMLIALLPVALWLHRRFDVLAIVWMAGLAMCVDVLRFRYGYDAVGWLNMLIVWGLAHQAGFFYDRLVAAPRRLDLALLWTGLFGLIGLVGSGLYPGSMVGVPGDKWSNMAPPTFVIIALLAFQMGVAEVLRPRMQRILQRPRWARANELINRFSLPLFLFHTTGMALYLVIGWALLGQRFVGNPEPDLWWWLERPVAVLGPLLCTLPVIWIFGRRWVSEARLRRPL
jgi:hypothetical protein